MTHDENGNRLLREIREELKTLGEILRGDDKGTWGLTHQVHLMWRAFIIWPLCTLSALAGAAGTLLLQQLFHK